jgi:hypothetical protein
VSSAATPPSDAVSTGGSGSGTRHGCLLSCLLIVVLAAGAVAAVRFWPRSMKDRQDAAIEACQNKVDDQYPTNAEKQWGSATAVGPDKDHFEVTGRFFSKDIGNATFSCTVQRRKVTDVFVSPG